MRELRNEFTSLLRRVAAGEEIAITRRGEVVARLAPAKRPSKRKVDWAASAAVTRDRSGDRMLGAEESARLLAESRGRF